MELKEKLQKKIEEYNRIASEIQKLSARINELNVNLLITKGEIKAIQEMINNDE